MESTPPGSFRRAIGYEAPLMARAKVVAAA